MALYADIVEIVAPSQASPGDSVVVTVRIKNLYSAAIGIMVGGALEYGVTPWPEVRFPIPSTNVDGGATYSFSGWFTMPDKAVTLHAYSYWYGADGYWNFDDEMTRKVSLITLSPQISDFKIKSYAKV